MIIYDSGAQSLAASGDTAAANVESVDTLGVQVTGTWVGTVAFFGSVDGTNYIALGMHAIGDTSLTSAVVSTTSNGVFVAPVAGLSKVKATFTRTSGTAVVTVVGFTPSK